MHIRLLIKIKFIYIYINLILISSLILSPSLSYVIFNAKMTLFDLTLPLPLTLAYNKDISNNVIFALKLHNWVNDT